MLFAKIENEIVIKIQENPTDPSVSQMWLDLEVAKSKGWLPITTVYEDITIFGYTHGDFIDTILEDEVVRTYPAELRTVEEQQSYMISVGKSIAESKMEDNYNIQEQIAALANLTTPGHKTAVITSLTNTIKKFIEFKEEVNAATTIAELEIIWNSYPILHED